LKEKQPGTPVLKHVFSKALTDYFRKYFWTFCTQKPQNNYESIGRNYSEMTQS